LQCARNGHALARELVNALVLVMTVMALDPVPAYVVALGGLSSLCHGSILRTDFLSAVRQPFRFQRPSAGEMPPRK
jgi:hypothetical protein